MPKKILTIIPARGGSEGIPRKNLRSLNGMPLIHYAIKCASESKYNLNIYISSDDDEIIYVAQQLGANTLKRNANIADNETTLDPVIYNAVIEIENKLKTTFELVITLQPTCPLLSTRSLDNAIELFDTKPEIDTVISATNDTHLTWSLNRGKFTPDFTKRVNRQLLTPRYKETGGFLITQRQYISETNRIGSNVQLYELHSPESIDIDTHEDFALCEYFAKRKVIVFAITGNKKNGLGHVHRALILANYLVAHQLEFIVDRESLMAYDLIRSKKYNAHIQKSINLAEDILLLNPHIVINDILDTDTFYMTQLKKNNTTIINFEDLGNGASLADLIINDLYPQQNQASEKHFFGPEFFCARDEFLLTKSLPFKQTIDSVLLSFGGTDPCNLTLKTLNAIYKFCMTNKIEIKVVTGLGYSDNELSTLFPEIQLFHNVKNIAGLMAQANIAITSAGRTLYELACIGTPAIVMAQNKREDTHFWVKEHSGFLYLGIGNDTEIETIKSALCSLVSNPNKVNTMKTALLETNMKNGTEKVMKLINNTIAKS